MSPVWVIAQYRSAIVSRQVNPEELAGLFGAAHLLHVAHWLELRLKQRSGASGRLVDSETTDRGKEVCRSRFGDTGPETGNPGSEPSKKVSLDAESAHADTDSEARRIANGLLKLEGAGAIKNETDASFYAHLIRAFDAQYLGKVDSNPSKPSGILEHAEPGMAKHGKPSIAGLRAPIRSTW